MMPVPLLSWRRFLGRCPRRRPAAPKVRPCGWQRLLLERLEDRTLLSGAAFTAAVPLSFTPAETAHVGHFLSDPREVDLYQVALSAGDRLHVAVSAQATGSGLQSRLRVFGPDHHHLALD